MSAHHQHRDNTEPHHHRHPHDNHNYGNHDDHHHDHREGDVGGSLSPQDIAMYRQLELLINHNPGIRHHLNNILQHQHQQSHFPPDHHHSNNHGRNAFSISNLSSITEDSKASLAGYHRHSSDSKIDYNNAPLNSTFNSGLVCHHHQESRSSSSHHGRRHGCSKADSRCMCCVQSSCGSSSVCSELMFTPSHSHSTDPHYPSAGNESCSTCRNASSCCSEGSHTTMTSRRHYPTPDIQEPQNFHQYHPRIGYGSTGSASNASSSFEDGCGSSEHIADLEESLHALSLAVNTSFSVCEYNCDEDSDSYAEEIDVDADTMTTSPCSGGPHRSSIWSAGVSCTEQDYVALPQGHGHSPGKMAQHNRIHQVFAEDLEHARHSPDGKECTPTPLSKVIARTVSSSLEEIDNSLLYGENDEMRSKTGASPALTRSSYCKCGHSSTGSNVSLRSRKQCSKSTSKVETSHRGSRSSVTYSSKSSESGESAASSGSRSNRSQHQSVCSVERESHRLPSSSRGDNSMEKPESMQKHSRKTDEKQVSQERKATEKHDKQGKKLMNTSHMTACSDASTISAARFCKMPPANCNSLAVQLGKIGLLKKIRKINKKIATPQSGHHDNNGKKGDAKNQSTFQHLGVL